MTIYSGTSAHDQLRDYLLAHENDIAWGINDFGLLANLFWECFDREPKAND